MTFDDFVTYFTEVSVCHLLNTSLFTFSRRWMGSSVYGHWTTGPRGSSADRAGGCANNVESFLRNPQYCFTIDSDDEEFIVQLSQPDVREKRADGVKNMTIGLHILKVYYASLFFFIAISLNVIHYFFISFFFSFPWKMCSCDFITHWSINYDGMSYFLLIFSYMLLFIVQYLFILLVVLMFKKVGIGFHFLKVCYAQLIFVIMSIDNSIIKYRRFHWLEFIPFFQ